MRINNSNKNKINKQAKKRRSTLRWVQSEQRHDMIKNNEIV